MAPVVIVVGWGLFAFASYLGQVGAALESRVVLCLIAPVNEVVAVLGCVGLWPIPLLCDVFYQPDQFGRVAHGVTVQHEYQVVVLLFRCFLFPRPEMCNPLGFVVAGKSFFQLSQKVRHCLIVSVVFVLAYVQSEEHDSREMAEHGVHLVLECCQYFFIAPKPPIGVDGQIHAV